MRDEINSTPISDQESLIINIDHSSNEAPTGLVYLLETIRVYISTLSVYLRLQKLLPIVML